jgi:hypothetical protein
MPENSDTISREAAKNALCQLCRDISNWRMCERNDECNLICRIDGVPAADVRPVVRGKWIDRDDDYYGWNMWACSACGEEFVLTEGTPDMNDYHFCPNCGADMRPQPPKEET